MSFEANSTVFLATLQSDYTESSIEDEAVNEALANMYLKLRNSYDVAYFMASMNLINAWIKTQKDNYNSVYLFKIHVVNKIGELLAKRIPDVSVYISQKEQVSYIRVFELQFSFHNLTLSDELKTFAASEDNHVQIWTGIRLQKKAQLVLSWTRQVRELYYRDYWYGRLLKPKKVRSDLFD